MGILQNQSRSSRIAVAAIASTLLFATTVTLPVRAQTFTVLYKFPNAATGSSPGGLIDVNGTLFGSTPGGGKAANGNIFKLTSLGKESTFYTFPAGGLNGVQPALGPLVRDK